MACVRGDKSSTHGIVNFNLIYTLSNSHKTATYPNLHDCQNHLAAYQNFRILDSSSGNQFSTGSSFAFGNYLAIYGDILCCHNWGGATGI